MAELGFRCRMAAAVLIAWRNCTPAEWAEEPEKLRESIEHASKLLEEVAHGVSASGTQTFPSHTPMKDTGRNE